MGLQERVEAMKRQETREANPLRQLLMGVDVEKIKETVRQTLKDLPIPESDCPICKGAEWVIPMVNGKPDYAHPRRCKCMREKDFQKRQEMYLRMCELPPATENMTFENYKVFPGLEEACEAARAIAYGNLKWLTLLSEVDRGKTHLAIAICREWLRQGKSAKYAFVPLLLDELRAGFDGKGGNSYQSRFEFFCNVNLLVLDDLGVERASDWAMEKLETIVDYRYIHKLPLVVTTNIALDNYSERIASRLKRSEDSKVVVIKATEYRLRRKQNGTNGNAS